MGLAEDLGKGIDRIEDDMAAELLQPPEFEDDGSFFTVRLRLGGAVTPRERAWVRTLIQDGRLDARAAVVVIAVARQGSISNSDVRSLLEVDSVQARAVLQGLVTEGVLIRQGERGGSQYLIAPDLGVPARIRHTDAERLAPGTVRPRPSGGPRRPVDRNQLVQVGAKRGDPVRAPLTSAILPRRCVDGPATARSEGPRGPAQPLKAACEPSRIDR
jgi:hypothetical protein